MKMNRILALLLSFSLMCGVLSTSGYADDTRASTAEADQIHYICVNPESPGDAFLVESNGKYMLVDTSNPDMATGGSQAVENHTANVTEVVEYLRQLHISRLDYVVLTHSHSDHVGGLVRLCQERFVDEDTVLYYRSEERSHEEDSHPDWENGRYLHMGLDAARANGAKLVCLAQAGITELTLNLGDFSIEFLNLDNDGDGVVDFDYDNENNNSIVLLITKGTVKTLLTGDIEESAEQAIKDEVGAVDVLKVPHHGNTTSSSYEFLKTLQPETAISTSFGYSQFGAYEYLTYIGTTIYTTGESRAQAIVEVVSEDGYEILGGSEYTLSVSDGWHSWLDSYYYVDSGQVVRDDWRKIGWDWYYFDEDGIMQTGETIIDGKYYAFLDNGAWRRPF